MPLDPADFSTQRFLEIKVSGESVGDRIPLVSVPFAFHAANADTATFVQNLCNQGDFLNCYTGPGGTMGVGLCQSGVRTCAADGTGFAACTGEVVPIPEECIDGEDDDCDGFVDDGCPCIEADKEPNDSEATFVQLLGKTDCDPTSQTLGTIADGSDEDWFRFHLGDNSICLLAPTVSEVADDDLEVCAFFDCDAGTGASVTCNSGSAATSPNGLDGCCTTAGTLNPTVNCAGTVDDDMQIFMRMKHIGGLACANYTLTYGG
jgi:hypothetical protein